MRPVLLLTALLLSLASKADWNYTYFPDILTVVRKFYTEHSIEYPPFVRGQREVHFEKRRDGWHIAIYEQQERMRDLTYWTLANGRYNALDLPKPEHIDEDAITAQTENVFSVGSYRFCPYFGYDGWFLDVIEDYGRVADIPDSVVYGVARAYSTAATALFNDQYGDAPPGFGWDLPHGKNSMTEQQLFTYHSYADRAIELFDRVYRMNPAFQSHVGEIKLKRDHEYVTRYLQLSIYQNEEEALKGLPKNLYDPFYLAMAKNFLNSCGQDAILFTNGDSDTYPLLYVQVVLGIRRDVTVVNMSLMNLGRYLAHVRAGIMGSLPIPMSVPEASWYGKETEVVGLREGNTEPIGLEQLAGMLVKAPHSPLLVGGYVELPSDRFTMDGKNGGPISWTSDHPYLIRSALAMYDMLAQNRWKRPIHWVTTMGSTYLAGLGSYMDLEGLTYQLVDRQASDAQPDLNDIPVGRPFSYHLFTEQFDWTCPEEVTNNQGRMITNYRLQVGNLAAALANSGADDSTKVVLDKLVTAYPDARYPEDRAMLPILTSYFLIGADIEANRLARSIARNTVHPPARPFDWTDGPKDPERMEHLKQAILERIISLCEEHGQQATADEVRRLR